MYHRNLTVQRNISINIYCNYTVTSILTDSLLFRFTTFSFILSCSDVIKDEFIYTLSAL